MTYLIDANVFIQAKNLHYGLDFCPAFWQWLIEHNATGRVFSIDRVADQIKAGDDELSEWAKKYGDSLFLATDSNVASYFSTVSTWVTQQDYEPAAVNSFFQIADYYLIAHALAGEHIVVTHEIPSYSERRIKIPDVCAGLDINFMTPYEMLRKECARFVLGNVNDEYSER
ncbi:MAG: DUF4411 family protein [Lentisphaerae bacterium]|nr:DUF4411 family protein [Lentisphaerota bacterium]